MVDRPTGPIAPWMAERMRMPPGSLLGTADVAELLGVTRQRVSQLRTDPTFPRTGVGYGRVGLWHRAGIECWAAAHRPARPEAGGRFAGEAGALLLAAERHARRLGLHWIDSGLFWLVVAEGEAGPALRGAVESMGITSAEIEVELQRMRGSDDRPKRSCRKNPQMQVFWHQPTGWPSRNAESGSKRSMSCARLSMRNRRRIIAVDCDRPMGDRTGG